MSDGSTAATIAGVAGGVISGHYAEKALRDSKEWNVTVKMENGTTRTVAMKSDPNLQPGEKVRVSENNVERYKAAAKKSDADHEDHDEEQHDKD